MQIGKKEQGARDVRIGGRIDGREKTRQKKGNCCLSPIYLLFR